MPFPSLVSLSDPLSSYIQKIVESYRSGPRPTPLPKAAAYPLTVFPRDVGSAKLLQKGYERLPREYQELLNGPAWHPAWDRNVVFKASAPRKELAGRFSGVDSTIEVDPEVFDPTGVAAHELVHAMTNRSIGSFVFPVNRRQEEFLADRLGKWLHPPYTDRTKYFEGYGVPDVRMSDATTNMDEFFTRKALNRRARKTMNPLEEFLNDLLGGGS